MIIKLSFLDSQGKTKNKVFKKQAGNGIESIKSQFAKYDKWKSCDFNLYYLSQRGEEVIISNDRQLEEYLSASKDSPKIWAKQSGRVKVKSDAEEFQQLKLSQIHAKEGSVISDNVFGMPCESVIINRNQPPLKFKPKEEQDYFQVSKANSKRYEQKDLFLGIMKKDIHMGINCANCQKRNIQGARYQCLLCYAFNLCEACESSLQFQHEHPLLKLNRPDKEFNRHHLQQLRSNINAQIDQERGQLRQEEVQAYLNQINQLTSNYEGLLRENQMLSNLNEENQDTIMRQKAKIEKLERQFRQTIQQQESNKNHCRFQPCQILDNIGEKIQIFINQKPIQRRSQRATNHMTNRRQISEQRIIFKAKEIAEKIGLDFQESLKFAKQFPSMRADQIIDKIIQ